MTLIESKRIFTHSVAEKASRKYMQMYVEYLKKHNPKITEDTFKRTDIDSRFIKGLYNFVDNDLSFLVNICKGIIIATMAVIIFFIYKWWLFNTSFISQLWIGAVIALIASILYHIDVRLVNIGIKRFLIWKFLNRRMNDLFMIFTLLSIDTLIHCNDGTCNIKLTEDIIPYWNQEMIDLDKWNTKEPILSNFWSIRDCIDIANRIGFSYDLSNTSIDADTVISEKYINDNGVVNWIKLKKSDTVITIFDVLEGNKRCGRRH